jgi:hypothetical protein
MNMNDNTSLRPSACVINSTDSDVCIVLLLSECVRGQKVHLALGERVVNIDDIHHRLDYAGMTPAALAVAYFMAGCDFNPGTHGAPHAAYLTGMVDMTDKGYKLEKGSRAEDYELPVLFAYLRRKGRTALISRAVVI